MAPATAERREAGTVEVPASPMQTSRGLRLHIRGLLGFLLPVLPCLALAYLCLAPVGTCGGATEHVSSSGSAHLEASAEASATLHVHPASEAPAASFATVGATRLEYQKGSSAPPMCRHAGCREGSTNSFFSQEKGSCFSIVTCSSCPRHPEGRPRICNLLGHRKGYQRLMQNILIPGAPPSSFAYRKATEEEILRTLPKPTPLSGPKGGAGQTASTRPASPSGAQEEEAEAFGSEAEEDFDSDGAFIEVSEGPYSIERANTASDNGGVDATASTTGHHGTKARASFLESMPGFDTYEVEESDSLEGPDYEANVGGSGMLLGTGVGAGGPRGLIVGHNEKRIFSLAPSGVVGDVSNCHVDHKGYTRIQVGVVVSWKDSQLPQPFVFGTFGPEAGRGSSRFSEKGEYEAEGDAALEDWGALPPSVGALASESDENTRLVAEGAADSVSGAAELHEEEAASAGAKGASESSGLAARGGPSPFHVPLTGTPSYLASFSQLSVGFIKRFFKKGDDDFADDEGGDGGDDEGEGRKRGGFFKKFLRRKSRDAQDDYEGNGEEGEGDMYENERGFGSRRGGRSKRRGMKKFGKKIKSIAKASEALLAGSGTGGASSASVEMSFDFSSPAAPKCGVPAVWKGRLRLSSLVRVSFNVRVLLAEVEGAFADFVSSAVALEIRCKERRGCTLEDSLISCVQVSCPKRRELKASLKGHLDAHAQAANEQLQKVAERPGAPQTVYNQEEEPPQEEDEQPLESPKEEPPPKKRAKVTLVLAGGVSERYPGAVPNHTSGESLVLMKGLGSPRSGTGSDLPHDQNSETPVVVLKWSKHLRAATVGNFVKANVSPQAATGIPNGALGRQICAIPDRPSSDVVLMRLLTSSSTLPVQTAHVSVLLEAARMVARVALREGFAVLLQPSRLY
ncbi:hypothetical protein cyc_08817 [Cyclospora cayetanensis]|uniref:Transmembrane protein n=1 Tax=Cyclospora cayetanensis TaxID=88456 RepID=A0A1D3DAY6_9EIME|nr:hypothetical protein cyc_08817 [Cyclospora cayetanensis]